ncbi:MAG: transcription antitermination factor NusB [Lachnospiraceae bacterium]|jgi:N utilization substance protein B
MGRRELREHIFKLLFLSEFNQAEEMPEQIGMYLEQLETLQEKDQQYMETKYARIKEHIAELDEEINKAATGWKTSRMSKVDLTILRLAVYEMCMDEEIPVKVAINEAVELSKKYGGEESSSFINGVLGKLASV